MITFFLLILLVSTAVSALNLGWVNVNSSNIIGKFDGSSDHVAFVHNNSMFLYSGSNFATNYIDVTLDFYKNLNFTRFDLKFNKTAYGSVSSPVDMTFETLKLVDALQMNSLAPYVSSFLTGPVDYSLLGSVYLSSNPTAPIPRVGTEMTYSPITKEYILFGGYNNAIIVTLSIIRKTYFNDLWAWNPVTKAWRMIQSFDSGSGYVTSTKPIMTAWHSFITIFRNNKYYALLADGVGDYYIKKDYASSAMWLLDLSTVSSTSANVLWINVTDYAPPVAVDGAKLVGDNNYTYAYRFGGYACTSNSISTRGGTSCYLQNFYRLTQSTLTWTTIPVSSSTPSNRAYHSSLFYNNRFYVIGGCYQSVTGGWSYYGDVNAYDVNSQSWLLISAYGSQMAGRRSHSSIILDNVIWNFGGWADQVVYSDITAILHDVSVAASNFYANGTALSYVTAGVKSSFTIQIRSSTKIVNGSNAISAYNWGDLLPYGTNLDFSVSLVGYSNYDSSIIFQQYSRKDTANFVDNNDGTYSIAFTLQSGTYYTLSITYLQNNEVVDIPGSPFTVKCQPAAVDASKTIVFGSGTVRAVKSESTHFYVMFRDQYYNPIPATSSLLAKLSFNATLSSGVIMPLYPSCLLASSGDWDASVMSTYTANKLTNPPVLVAYFEYTTPQISSFTMSVGYSGMPTSEIYTVETYDSVAVSQSLEDGAFAFMIIVLAVVFIIFVILLAYWNHSVIRAASQNYLFCVLIGSFIAIAGVWIRVYMADLNDSKCTASEWLIDIGFLFYAIPIIMKSHFISKIDSSYNGFVLVDNFGLFVPILCTIAIECIISGVQLGYAPQYLKLYSMPNQSYLTYHDCGSDSYVFVSLLYGYKAISGIYFAVSSAKSDIMHLEGIMLASASFHMAFVYFIALPMILFISTPSVIYGLEVFTALWVVFVTVLITFLPKIYFIFFGEPFEFEGNDVYDINLPTGTMGVTQTGASAASEIDVNETKEKAAKGLRDDVNTADTELNALKEFIAKHNAMIERLEAENAKLRLTSGMASPLSSFNSPLSMSPNLSEVGSNNVSPRGIIYSNENSPRGGDVVVELPTIKMSENNSI